MRYSDDLYSVDNDTGFKIVGDYWMTSNKISFEFDATPSICIRPLNFVMIFIILMKKSILN
jgi:hypothetical protein